MPQRRSSLKEILANAIQIGSNQRYQIMQMVSMGLWHSLWFSPCGKNWPRSSIILLSVFSQIDVQILKLLFIMITLLLVIKLIVQTIILKRPNYFVQIIQRLLFPLEVHVAMLILNKRKDIQQKEFNQVSYTIFLVGLGITLGILILKNTKMSLRYKECSEKGLNRLFIYEFYLMLIKIFVVFLISCFLSENRLLLMGVIALINIAFNASFIFFPIYEHPIIQYLAMLTQFYIWIPLACLAFSEILHINQIAVEIFGLVGFLGYFCGGIFKSKTLVRILEWKYTGNAKSFSSGQKSKFIQRDEEDDTIILMGILSQISSQNSVYKLKWSQEFIYLVFNSILQRHRLLMLSNEMNKIPSQQNLLVKQTQKKLGQKGSKKDQANNSPSLMNIVHGNHSERNFDVKILGQQKLEESLTASKQMLSQIVFNLLSYPWLSQQSETQNYSKLRMFCCYDFGIFKDAWRRFWIFYGFDCKGEELSWFQDIQKKICYKTLMEQFGGHRMRRYRQSVMQSQENFSIKEKIQEIQSDTQINEMQNDGQKCQGEKVDHVLNQSKYMNCLTRPTLLYNSQFNQFYRQNRLRQQILRTFQRVICNQHIFLKIYQNMLQNKQDLRPYYYERRELKLSLEGLMKEYREVVIRSEKSWTEGANFWIIIKFIYRRWVMKQQFIACKDWQKDIDKLQTIMTQKRLQMKISELLKNDYSRHCLMDFVKKQNVYQLQEQNAGVMIISGYRDLGRIQCCSQSLKLALQLDLGNNKNNGKYSKNDLQLTQNTSQISINDLFLINQWGSEHGKLMSKYFKKSNDQLNHCNKKCYLRNQNAIVQMKFKLYYSMQMENDILVVIDCRFKQIDQIKVIDEGGNIIFNKRGNETNHKSDSQFQDIKNQIDENDKNQEKGLKRRLLQNRDLQGNKNCKASYDDKGVRKLSITTLIFDRTYHITQLRQDKPMVKQIELQRQFKQADEPFFSTIKDIPVQNQSSLLEQQENLSIYKQQFNHYDFQWTFLKRIVKTSVLFYFITFSYYLYEQNCNNQNILMLIKDKIRLQNDFIMQDEFTSMHVGMMFAMERVFGNLEQNGAIQQQQTNKIINDLFAFSKASITLISDKYPAMSQQIDTSFLFSHMAKLDHIPISNHSLLTHLLMKQILFFSLVSTFTNLTELMSSNSSSYKNYTIGDLRLTENSDKLIGDFFFQTMQMSNYVYEANGVIEDILRLQQEMFLKNQNFRNIFFWFFESIFLIFSTLILYLVIRIKKSILNHYNDSIHLSQKFIENFTQDVTALELIIKQLYNITKSHNSDQSQKKSQQQKISRHSSFESLTKEKKAYLTTKLRPPRFQQVKLSLLSFFSQSIIFPFVRWFVVMGAILAVYIMASQRALMLQEYSTGVTSLARLNAYLIQGLGFSLYQQKAKQSISPQLMQSKFEQIMGKVREIDKAIIIKQLYPFHQQFGKDLLYSKTTLHQHFNIPKPFNVSFQSQTFTSFQQNLNSLTFNENILFKHSLDSKLNHMKQRLSQTYYKINEIVETLIQITKKSFFMIEDDVQANYLNVFVGVLAFLIFQFIMGCRHFDMMYFQFYQEYLNVGTCRELKKQHGYEYFVNLAQSLAKHNPKPLQL